MKRLAHFARPYTKMVAAGLVLSILVALFDLCVPSGLVLSILVALFDLCVPYLTKIAIDRYILVSWYKIDGKILSDQADGDLRRRYGALMDQREITRWFPEGETGLYKMADGASMVSYEQLERLPKKEILQIRAGDINGVTLVAGVFLVLLLLSLGFSYVCRILYYGIDGSTDHARHTHDAL
ncbi:MAG: hypothetical protein B6240_15230 [Desulfobacteraceae bacterium 4572_87]|nr:MAG: hypothetical protein B6240_15230 [Desulfobacteraceae bacterium 4572_87]